MADAAKMAGRRRAGLHADGEMRIVEDFSGLAAFEMTGPVGRPLPLLFNSPHSGCCYPLSFLAQSRLDARRIRKSEDAFVDRLFSTVPEFGASLMTVNFPRAFLDVNREPFELDPRMFVGDLPPHANSRSLRVAGGLGTVARVVAENEEIYHRPLPVAEALERIETFYFPYHAALGATLRTMRERFGMALLIDCHSMPSNLKLPDLPAPVDIVIGDRYGTSAASGFVELMADLMEELGFSVMRNKPYAGGFITEHYGRPHDGVHAVQIEINRALYMDEARYEPSPSFHEIAARLTVFAARLAEHLSGAMQWPAQAAE